MSNSIVASRYTNALINTTDSKDIESVVMALTATIEAIEGSESVKACLDNPLTEKSKKTIVIDSIIKQTKEEKALNAFFSLLIKKNRLGLLADIKTSAQTALLKVKNTAKTRIITAGPIDETSQQKLIQQIQVQSDKALDVTFETDDSLIGGFKVFVDNKVYDGSIKNTLNKLVKS